MKLEAIELNKKYFCIGLHIKNHGTEIFGNFIINELNISKENYINILKNNYVKYDSYNFEYYFENKKNTEKAIEELESYLIMNKLTE